MKEGLYGNGWNAVSVFTFQLERLPERYAYVIAIMDDVDGWWARGAQLFECRKEATQRATELANSGIKMQVSVHCAHAEEPVEIKWLPAPGETMTATAHKY